MSPSVTDFEVSFWDAFTFGMPSLMLAGAIAFGAAIFGVFVLLKRHTLAALAIPQAVAIGVAVGLRLTWPTWLTTQGPLGTHATLIPAAAAVLLSILLLASTRTAAHVDALLAACYVGGLSISILIMANAGAHVTDMEKRFVGIDVAVDYADVWTVGPVLLGLGVICALLWRRWLLLAQAPAVAELAGLRPARWHYGFHALLAVIVMVGTNSQGVVMVLALLFLPAATVLPWVRRVPGAIVASVIAALLFTVAGDILSIQMQLPFSQSVGGVGFVALIVSRLAAMVFG
jgi:manganese/zinc/iron transport system permease protein